MTDLPPHLVAHEARFKEILAKLERDPSLRDTPPDQFAYFARRLLERELGIEPPMIDPSRRPPPDLPDETPRAPIANDDAGDESEEDESDDAPVPARLLAQHTEVGLTHEGMLRASPKASSTEAGRIRKVLLDRAKADLRAEGVEVQIVRLARMRTSALVGAGSHGLVVIFAEPYTKLKAVARDLVRILDMDPRPTDVRIYIPDAHPVEVDATLDVGRIRASIVRVPVEGIPEQEPPGPFSHELRVRVYREADDEEAGEP